MSVAEIASAIKIPEAKVRATVERMTESGLLESMGSGKGRVYILSARAYQNKAGYVRQTDIAKIRHEELVLQLVEAKERITRNDVMELLHVTPIQAYRLLRKMVESGSLLQHGTTRNTYYQKSKR